MRLTVNRADRVHAAQLQAIRETVDGFAREQFVAAGTYYAADQAEFLRRVVPVVLAARRHVSALTDAHQAEALTSLLRRPVPPRGAIDTDKLRGVDATEVYSRAHRLVWWHISRDDSDLEAGVKAGLARLSTQIASDLQMSQTFTAAAVLGGVPGVAMRRQITGAGTCLACTGDASHEYAAGAVLPHHPGCSCLPKPVLAGSLGTTRHEAVKVEGHDELGPLLSVSAPATP